MLDDATSCADWWPSLCATSDRNTIVKDDVFGATVLRTVDTGSKVAHHQHRLKLPDTAASVCMLHRIGRYNSSYDEEGSGWSWCSASIAAVATWGSPTVNHH